MAKNKAILAWYLFTCLQTLVKRIDKLIMAGKTVSVLYFSEELSYTSSARPLAIGRRTLLAVLVFTLHYLVVAIYTPSHALL